MNDQASESGRGANRGGGCDIHLEEVILELSDAQSYESMLKQQQQQKESTFFLYVKAQFGSIWFHLDRPDGPKWNQNERAGWRPAAMAKAEIGNSHAPINQSIKNATKLQ